MKPVVGLTGGIACGKTTVAKMFGDLGIPVIDADDLSREVVQPGTPGLARIVAEFGEEVLGVDGTLDRKRLADVVFEDQEARAKLNGILHPLIGAAGAQHVATLQNTAAPYILYEAALLVETGSHKAFSALIVVGAGEAVQRERLVERDRVTREEADARIASQASLAEKIAVADHVIINDGDLESTRSQVATVHEKLSSRFAREGST